MAKLSLHSRLRQGGFTLAVDEELEIDGIAALFGRSGAGKTTLLRVVAGLETDSRGRVALDGRVWQDDDDGSFVAAHRRSVGFVFQDGRLFPHLSVARNLTFGARRRRRSPIRAEDVIGALDLGNLLGRAPRSLSGGEKQRVAIGRALLAGPDLLMMDEPLSSLDVGRKAEILPYIERLPQAFGLPILYVTHNVEEVARLASNMLLLEAGQVVARGTVAALLERSDLWSLTGRLDAGVLLEAQVVAHSAGMTVLEVSGQPLKIAALEVAAGAWVRLRVQARDVALAIEPPRGLSIRNILAARIIEVEDAGVHAEVLLVKSVAFDAAL
jgi:molybdate transport system ATP-binding protein